MSTRLFLTEMLPAFLALMPEYFRNIVPAIVEETNLKTALVFCAHAFTYLSSAIVQIWLRDDVPVLDGDDNREAIQGNAHGVHFGACNRAAHTRRFDLRETSAVALLAGVGAPWHAVVVVTAMEHLLRYTNVLVLKPHQGDFGVPSEFPISVTQETQMETKKQRASCVLTSALGMHRTMEKR